MNKRAALNFYAAATKFLVLVAVKGAARSKTEDQLSDKLNKVFQKAANKIEKEFVNRGGVNPLATDIITNPLYLARRELTDTILGSYIDAGVPNAREVLRDNIFKASDRIMTRLQGDVSKTLSDAYAEGLGPDAIAQRLRDELGNLTETESTRIARTEVNSAQNMSSFDQLRQARIDYHQWWTVEDNKVRDSHIEMHGEIVKVGELFSNGLRFPGDKSGPIEEWINCRCVAVPFIMPYGKVAPWDGPFFESDLIEVGGDEPDAEEVSLKEGGKPKVNLEALERFLSEHPQADVSIKGLADLEAAWRAGEIAELGGPIAFKQAARRIVVGPVLVPGEPDHEGESLTPEKIEEVAYGFMESFRYIDLSHSLKQVGIPVSSDLLRQPEEYTLGDGSVLKLPTGTWMLGVKVKDDATWKGVEGGALKGFSVMGVKRAAFDSLMAASKAAGLPLGAKLEDGVLKKILLQDLGEDWIGVAVSILSNPSVFKSRFIAIKSADEKPGLLTRLLERVGIKEKDSISVGKTKPKTEDKDMTKEEFLQLFNEAADARDAAKTKTADEAAAKAKADSAQKPADEPDKTKEPPPPPAAADASKADAAGASPEVAALKGEMAKLTEVIKQQGTILEKLGELGKAQAAVKSQRIIGPDVPVKDTDKGAGKTREIRRDAFGCVIPD